MEQAATVRDTGVRPTARRHLPKSKQSAISACRSKALLDFEPEGDLEEIEWMQADLIEAWEQGICHELVWCLAVF